MKTGILTFPNSVSYGAVLQMYALYRVVGKLGHDAEIINYHNAYMKSRKHYVTKGSRRGLRGGLKYYIGRLIHRRLEKNFRDFEKRNLTLFPKNAFTDKKKFSFADERYDAVICGSDQVWNPDITDSDISYFLDFCGKETKRISYAPSFGVETLSPEFLRAAGNELKHFSAVSVRENAGRSLLAQEGIGDVSIVVDPTMLLNRDEWSELESEHPLGQGEYILYYTIRSSAKLMSYCKSLSEKTGIRIVIIGGNMIKNLQNKDPRIAYATNISPGEWLYLIHHARYVVTNSFHGVAFSINYRKNFYVEFSSYTNSRLQYITDMLKLQDRVIRGSEGVRADACDYSETDRLLPCYCAESEKFLRDALREDV